MTDQEVQQYLEDNGYPPHIVRGGKQGLLERWKKFVDEVEQGYEFGIDDYRNDLDVRGIIALVGLDAEVADADRRLQSILTNTDVRIWESNESAPFWDFGYPRNAKGELLRDLKSEGVVE